MERTVGSILEYLRTESPNHHIQPLLKIWEDLIDQNDIVEHSEVYPLQLRVMKVLIGRNKFNKNIKIIFCYTFWQDRGKELISIGLCYDSKGLSAKKWFERNEKPFDFLFQKSFDDLNDDYIQSTVSWPMKDTCAKELIYIFNPINGKNWKKFVTPRLHIIIKNIWKQILEIK
jgi:hypothetical protein